MSRFSNLELRSEGDAEHRGEFRERIVTKDAAWYLTAAQTAWEEGDFELALRHFGKVIESNPALPEGWSGQVKMLIELGQLGEAKLWADKALERFPNEPDLLAAKGVALARNGDLDGAMAYSDSSFSERGESAYLWLARGDVLLSRKEPRADYCFQKMSSLEPRNWFWRWMAARVHYFHRQFALGLKMAQEALNLDASHGMAWLELAACQQELGLGGASRESLEQARQLSPRDPQIERALAGWQKSGWWEKLRGWWRQRNSS
jgi:tetratricopeptide (TPR) repeat protein